jgi:hypothetical protein
VGCLLLDAFCHTSQSSAVTDADHGTS